MVTRVIPQPIVNVGVPAVFMYSVGSVVGCIGVTGRRRHMLVRHIHYGRGLLAIVEASAKRDRWWRLRRLWRWLFPVRWTWPEDVR